MCCQTTRQSPVLPHSCARRLGPVLRCPGAANHHDPVMTPYRPFTCLAATLARCGCPGAWRGSLPGVPVPLEPAEAPRFAPRQRRALVPYRSSHTGSWFAAYETRLCPVAGISGPAGLDNHRNPATTSYHPGGEPGHTLIDTQMGDHDDNWDVVVLMGKFLPDVHREPHRVNGSGTSSRSSCRSGAPSAARSRRPPA